MKKVKANPPHDVTIGDLVKALDPLGMTISIEIQPKPPVKKPRKRSK